MLINEAERRAYQRLPVECKVAYKQLGDQGFLYAEGKNLSGNGIMFIADRAVNVGTKLEIDVIPNTEKLQPLSAVVKVIRMEPRPSARQFAIGATIEEVLN